MVNLVENEEKTDSITTIKFNNDNKQPRESKSEVIQNHLKGMKGVVKKLENSLTESHLEQRHLLIQMHMDDIKNQNVTTQLEEARKENKQLLNIMQQKCHENDIPRSQIDVTAAYSTMSVVNLQYKYEELLAKYEGLLKIMTSRDKDIKRCHQENEKVTEELHATLKKLHECEFTLKKVCDKYMALKQRKDTKIDQLKTEKETLRLAHNQVVRLLHQQCTKNEDILMRQLHRTLKPERALLLKEVQRSNKFQHENILLKQEIACLKSKCNFPNLSVSKNDKVEDKMNK
ncbi:hypothetical protein ILUMI_01262 [Ignelater luminosus]|uniref:Uncharacterized protein n=1 Tax=Ignelater luminosus TaxID=2038154 RepID=A0A8K0GME6_IGNLU|nr:hypothetical protein ILUMI_01262 [Ignelater luminosus]